MEKQGLVDDLTYKLAISLLPGIGPIKARKLVSYVGSIEGIFKEKVSALEKIPGIGSILASKVNIDNVLDSAKKESEFISKYNIRPYFYLDSDYPKSLQKYDDSPLMIFVKGEFDFNKGKFISMVGTRKMSHYGGELCEKMISDLVKAGFKPTIVSGLAYGVDHCAHNAALNNGLKTLAVLGHGLDMIYPSSHKELAKKIIENGALVTEFASSSKRDAANFVRRNRIIAALSTATVVVETPVKGGSLITAEFAVQYSKDVFTFPGRVGDKNSAGCNYLIKTNRAALIENADDLIYALSWEKSKKSPLQAQVFVELNPDEEKIVQLLREQEFVNVDSIVYESKLPINKVLALLFNLEFNNIVKALPGRMYKLIND
ncbi:MAG: DNA-processing protein DprA [Bacteroidales bacterium]|nr:DNA-processing protein DprA [Bacteroidales bacterium]